MARTELSSAQIRDATIARADLNTVTPGSAVVAKIVAGAGITISQTGADSGTGDVTVTVTGGGAPAAHRITHETGGTDALTALSAAILTTGNLPFARVQLSASPRLLGRGTAAAGAMEELTLGTGLSMAGTVLNVGALAPAAHATTHQPGGSDPMAVDAVVATGSLRTIGTGAQQACAGNDARLTNARTPTAHASTHQPGGGDAMAVDAVAATGSLRTLGTGATQAAAGTDARFTDARTPTVHATTHKSGGSDPIALDTLAATTDITTLNASATAHGLLPKLSNVVTQFLTGTGTWAVPAGGTPSAHATTHNTGGGDPLTALSAAILTTGTLPFARVQLSASPRLLGRGTAAAGAMEEITLGTGLSMTATTLSITGADEVFIGTADPGAAYELWYDTDEPGIDPTVLSHHVSHEPGGADALANAVWTNVANVFTNRTQQLVASTPFIGIQDTAQAVDARAFIIQNSGGTLKIAAYNDAYTVLAATPLTLSRTGNVDVGGLLNVVLSGTVRIKLTDTSQATNQKQWQLYNSGGQFGIFAALDTGALDVAQIWINRVGTFHVGGRINLAVSGSGENPADPGFRKGAGPAVEVVTGNNSNWAGLRCGTLDCYSTATFAASLTANGGIAAFQSLILTDGANPQVTIQNNGNYLRFYSSNYGQVMYMDMAGNFTTIANLITGGYGQFNNGIYERSRAAALGNWTAYTPTVTPSGGGPFTVGANYGSWSVHGGTCIYRFSIENGTLANPSACGSFYISLPFSQVGAGLVTDCAVRFYIGWTGQSEVGFGEIAPGDPSRILVYRFAGGAFPAGTGAALYCRGTVIYQII